MKKYTTPNIEVTKFDVEDIIMDSSVSLGKNTTADKTVAKDALRSAGYVAVEW